MGSRTLVVTGASRGIGAATARLAAGRGWAVCVNYASDTAAAEGVVAAITAAGGRAVAVRADVADEADVVRLFDSAHHALGPIGGLVNNAGITGRIGTLAETGAADLRRLLDVNLLGAMLCAREAVRRMATSRGGAGGAIVNVGSVASLLGGANEWVGYAAAKGGLDSFTVGLAREVGPEGIRVNAVQPALIKTEVHARAGDPERPARIGKTLALGRAGEPDEVAEAILWLLSDAASFVTAAHLRVSGGR